MTASLAAVPATADELSTAAAVLLTQALARHRLTGSPLGVDAIALADRYAISHTGPGTQIVSAQQAWTELVDRGLVVGTVDAWIPTIGEVRNDRP